MDTFDKIISSIYREKRPVITGCVWQSGWAGAKGGIIDSEGNPQFGHAFCAIGRKTINGKLYLIVQGSNGKNIGDKGLFYFSRPIVNKFFKFGAFMFRDFDPNEAKQICWSLRRRIYEIIKSWFKEILK